MNLAIRLDAVGGIAGDMFVAAMVDALPELRDRALADAAAVLPQEAGRPLFETGMSGGMRALRFRLAAGAERTHQHTHADFRDMVARIEAAALSPGTAWHATAILRHLAEAEAAIHDVPVDQVHFHEIGDWDSLMDVTAAGSIAAALDGARWSVGTLPRGDGLVETRHGLLPVPTPATTRLLAGFTFRDDGIGGERVTPTGAAILRHLITAPEAQVGGRLRASGTGAGLRELRGLPNILRATLFDAAAGPQDAAGPEEEDVLVLCFEIDDMTGEELALAADRLRDLRGVRDVVLVPAIGKKGRPIHSFRLLVDPGQRQAVAEACFTETATIGLRWQVARRAVLPRAVSADRSLPVKTVIRPSGTSRKAQSDGLGGIAGLDARRAAKRAAEEP